MDSWFNAYPDHLKGNDDLVLVRSYCETKRKQNENWAQKQLLMFFLTAQPSLKNFETHHQRAVLPGKHARNEAFSHIALVHGHALLPFGIFEYISAVFLVCLCFNSQALGDFPVFKLMTWGDKSLVVDLITDEANRLGA